jgi:hypothetical protein
MCSLVVHRRYFLLSNTIWRRSSGPYSDMQTKALRLVPHALTSSPASQRLHINVFRTRLKGYSGLPYLPHFLSIIEWRCFLKQFSAFLAEITSYFLSFWNSPWSTTGEDCHQACGTDVPTSCQRDSCIHSGKDICTMETTDTHTNMIYESMNGRCDLQWRLRVCLMVQYMYCTSSLSVTRTYCTACSQPVYPVSDKVDVATPYHRTRIKSSQLSIHQLSW